MSGCGPVCPVTRCRSWKRCSAAWRPTWPERAGGPSGPDRGPHRGPAQPRHRGPELCHLAGEFRDSAAALARVTRLGDLADAADFPIKRGEITFARPGMSAAIGHRRAAVRAAGCFAHIGERYAWERRRAMTPAPNPARPVLGRGTRRVARGTRPDP